MFDFLSKTQRIKTQGIVAAINIPGHRDLRIFYPVRVVSPGDYLVPPPLVEDMYKPYIKGTGDGLGLMQVTNP